MLERIPVVASERGDSSRRVVSVAVGDLRLDPDAMPDQGKLVALMENSPKFKRSLQKKRTNFKNGDQSPSVYDLSIAAYAMQSQWSDQEIVDLLIMNRRRWGLDLKLRADYYKRTLEKVRERD